MILDGMTSTEALTEFYGKYLNDIDKFVEGTLRKNEKKIRKGLKSGGVIVRKRTIDLGDQKFYVILYPWIVKGTGELGTDYLVYTFIQNKYSGKKSIIYFPIQEDNMDFVIIYENHLLKRYRDRFLGLSQDEISFDDLAEKFMRGNKMSSIMVNPNGNIECRILDGILLGNLVDGIVRFKTFITSDMATRDYQEKVKNENLEILIEGLERNDNYKNLKLPGMTAGGVLIETENL